MDGEKNLQALIELINRIMLPLILLVAGVFIYFLYNIDFLRQFVKLLVPLALYASGLGGAYWFRNRKKKFLIFDNGTQEIRITVNYFSLFWHDCLVFLTPALILGFIAWFKGSVEWSDIVASAICFVGLYLSELIYKRKII